MKILVLLNQDSGTLKTTSLADLTTYIEAEFQVHGHEVEVLRCGGEALIETLKKSADREDLDVLIVGGGDGTVSAAASLLASKRMALGVLPAGTMNLFARTLQIPLDLRGAVAALASGDIIEVDYATMNGQPFVHQYALGLHARMVRIREKFKYGSRIGKMIATSRAIFTAIRRLPAVEVDLTIDGHTRIIRTPAVALSNNLYGPGHLPYADDPKGAKLGLYICNERSVTKVMKLAIDILTGTWKDKPGLDVQTADKVVIHYGGRNHKRRAVLDGELVDLPEVAEIEIHPGGLHVLAPSDATYRRDAA